MKNSKSTLILILSVLLVSVTLYCIDKHAQAEKFRNAMNNCHELVLYQADSIAKITSEYESEVDSLKDEIIRILSERD